ncbi:hypothetical protein BZG36_01067 [Bifiguratus adelaidae]|uniref:RING-type domain-containing protein n=1 Tax=Bifiguratus adelaidae TaxID=1938954 RepID=A0A261Y600_9FUNG|nr:hypothetical protein BZG36_01067 [Bifiguratus adelaidae]
MASGEAPIDDTQTQEDTFVIESSSQAAHTASPTTAPPSTPISTSSNVRRHWWDFLSSNWRQISRASQAVLAFTILFSLIQMVATVTILATSDAQMCDGGNTLVLFLSLYVIRVGIVTPIRVYQYLHPQNRRRRNGDSDYEHPPLSQVAGWIDRAKSILDLFSTIWFILGNYLLLTSMSCQHNQPGLFYLTLTWIVCGYIVVAIPIFLCGTVIFCLPCLLVAMRSLGFSDIVPNAGASPADIKAIPLVRFHPMEHSDDLDMGPSMVQKNRHPEPSAPAPKHGPSEYRLPAQDAVCAICICDYEQGDLLRLLPCRHHFHQSCVDEWMSLNRACPLCKQSAVHVNAS